LKKENRWRKVDASNYRMEIREGVNIRLRYLELWNKMWQQGQNNANWLYLCKVEHISPKNSISNFTGKNTGRFWCQIKCDNELVVAMRKSLVYHQTSFYLINNRRKGKIRVLSSPGENGRNLRVQQPHIKFGRNTVFIDSSRCIISFYLEK